MSSACIRQAGLGARMLIALLCAGAALALAVPPSSAQTTGGAIATVPPDALEFPIPAGFFFEEGVPAATGGRGFAVQDGQGAAMWTAFQAAGGVTALGYPISRRFEVNGDIAQAFSGGVLRWNRDSSEADTLSGNDLPSHKPPAYAVQAELPPLAGADIEPQAWSGWWWPAFNGVGPTLFATNGPLDKYDTYVERLTGQNPQTRDWERQQVYFPNTPWAGHCNGFAAAALLEPEPTQPVNALGVDFSVDDLKGLLVDYHFGDASAWSFGSDDTEVTPAEFQHVLLDLASVESKGFVLTFDMGGGEVWSYPVFRYASEWTPDPIQDGLWHVRTTLWMADMQVPPGFVGTRPFPGPNGQTFTYDLTGDPRHPGDGAWTGASTSGRFAHPSRLWYPDAKARNPDPRLVSPGLDRAKLTQLLAS